MAPRKNKKATLFIPSIVYVFAAALSIRLFLANFGTLEIDHLTYVSWAHSLVSNGFSKFYNGWCDYLPGYMYILWFLGLINQILPSFQTLLFKLPAIVSDLATAYIIYKIAIKAKKPKLALGASVLYLFNPAIIGNSTLWGQTDSITSLFSLAAVYMASLGNIFVSSVLLSLGTLIKPQAAFVAPAIVYLALKSRWSIKNIATYIISGLGLFVVAFIPFNNNGNLINFIIERLSVSSGHYPYGSVNAFSFWGLWGFWKPDNVTFWIGLVMTIIVISYSLIRALRVKKPLMEYQLAAISLLTTFIFLTRMHERHLLPVLAPLLAGALINPANLVFYSIFSMTYIANLYYAYIWITKDFKEVFNGFFINVFIVINTLSLVVFTVSSYSKKLSDLLIKTLTSIVMVMKKKRREIAVSFSFPDITKKMSGILILAIVLFAFITRTFRLFHPPEMYFDEVYHAFTAKLMLHADPKAWEWWNPHPEGFAYEWTHPPLAKLGMALGMKILGENAAGWRIVQAILGTACIYLIYLLVKDVFKDRLMAVFAAGVFALEGLPLVASRIGMNDAYMLFFVLLSIYLFVKDKSFLSAFSFGLAISSKWSAIYAVPIFFMAHMVLKKKINAKYLFFAVIPILVYIASYTQMFTTKHSWDQFIGVQKQMWWYHTNLDAEHPYTSPALSWPFLARPIYLYNGHEDNQTVERIYAFGNPVIFWVGVISVIISSIISFKEKNKKLGFLIFSYFIFFIPWAGSPRIMFLYHYLPSIPFMCAIIAYVLRRNIKVAYFFFPLAFLVFVYFYPHLIGLRIPEALDKSYYWFANWR